jgi:NAD(P)-dependent dehydrogenase (short-subunit alcohol dehydrogenase family)|eukprot:COSAG01_NODE_7736_length_3079_cov_6.242617_3_plen_203_part_00
MGTGGPSDGAYGTFAMAGKSVVVTGGASGIGVSRCANPRCTHAPHNYCWRSLCVTFVSSTEPATSLQHLAQYAISELFASRGANVFLLDLFPESTMKAAADLRESTGGNVVGIPCDVADATAVAAAFDKIKAAGRVDCMINNAGIAAVGNVETATDAIMDRVYNVNVKGVFHCLQESCKAMTSDNKGGVIVNLASVSLACLY